MEDPSFSLSERSSPSWPTCFWGYLFAAMRLCEIQVRGKLGHHSRISLPFVLFWTLGAKEFPDKPHLGAGVTAAGLVKPLVLQIYSGQQNKRSYKIKSNIHLSLKKQQKQPPPLTSWVSVLRKGIRSNFIMRTRRKIISNYPNKLSELHLVNAHSVSLFSVRMKYQILFLPYARIKWTECFGLLNPTNAKVFHTTASKTEA